MNKTGGFVTTSGDFLCVHCNDQVRPSHAPLWEQTLRPGMVCSKCGKPLLDAMKVPPPASEPESGEDDLSLDMPDTFGAEPAKKKPRGLFRRKEKG